MLLWKKIESTFMSKQAPKAVFLDRDGVLNHDHNYVFRLEDLEILKNVPEGLRLLRDAGYLFFVVTNQSGVARGLFSLDQAMEFNAALAEALRQDGIVIEEFFICPHREIGESKEFAFVCKCRKPSAHFVEYAVEKYQLDRKRCFMIGDRGSDLDCARNAQITPIWMENSEHLLVEEQVLRAQDFLAAAKIILEKS